MDKTRSVCVFVVAALLQACAATATPSAPTSVPSAADSTHASLGPAIVHATLAGPSIDGAFDVTTNGPVIAWSNGKVDQDAPELWRFLAATGQMMRVYRSDDPTAVLANLAVDGSRYAFAEVRRSGDARTWRLVVVDEAGSVKVIDTNDVPSDATGILPMVALGESLVVWATNHRGTGTETVCQLMEADLATLTKRIVESRPCTDTEYWYPASDGSSFVYGTVEYGPDHNADDRHVYLYQPPGLRPVQLDVDGEASWPAILGDSVVWKKAPRQFNMLNPGHLVQYSIHDKSAVPLGYENLAGGGLISPSVGPHFIAGQGNDPLKVSIWSRQTNAEVVVDRLDVSDPGFFSATQIGGDTLVWFYTNTTQGGGVREIRWTNVAQ